MLVYIGFIILTFAGSGLAGHKPTKCKNPEHSCPKNEHYTRNNPRCIRTCANKWVPNSDDCKSFTGCVCNDGLVRLNDDGTGPCVSERECPNKCKDKNAMFKKCPNPCPLSCDHPFSKVCSKMCLESGCECAPGFILDCNDSNGKCIRPEDCPKPIRCPKHSRYVINDNQCPKTCGNRLLPNSDVAGICAPFTGCACKHGYVRKYDNATGPCIKEDKCPPIPTECGVNEEPTSCAIVCPPQTCDSIFSSYYCLPTECEPGCDCLNEFLRNDDGICIPSYDCFKPDPIECNGPNEVYSDCVYTCPPQSCESLFVNYLCAAEITCTEGCRCLDGYLRNSLGECVSIDECYNDPAGCNGDLNATRARDCGNPNPPTCENPEPEGKSDICVLNGCQCKQGYVVGDDGNCIAANDCPGGSPICGANKTYVDCKFGCPTNYCPVDDSRAQVACSLAYPCQGGCACIAGHLIVSPEDPRCVLASDCPEVECTRQNEVWDPNPSGCFLERCDDRGSKCDYPYPSGPRCVCREGYYRNEDDVCIPALECPPLDCNGDFNATLKNCPDPCPKTCDDPEAGDSGCIEICLETDCQCNDGYFLTKIGGTCIKPEDCESCKGDPNAVYSYCPSACEPTCEKPDRNQVCTRQCMAPGCICRDGFVLNQETGKCIKPENCPNSACGGDPNAVYSTCPSACERTCENPDPQICTLQCLEPGCVCKPGYVKSAGGKCIKLEACPDSACGGDPNAVYSTCPSACERTCENPDPQICTLQCLEPGCVCKPGYVKSAGGKCIKLEACPADGCNGDRNATFNECPSYCPRTCDSQDSDRVCIAACAPRGCACNPGYVLTAQADGGKCVLPKDCPVKDKGCNGDLNATHSECPSFCPVTCENRHSEENVLCPAVCDPSFCVCKRGYLLTKKGGKCVKPEDCPVPGCNGDPNAEYKECPSACEPTCTNPDPEFCTKQCIPPGCVCKNGFVLNEETGTCVEREKCPGCLELLGKPLKEEDIGLVSKIPLWRSSCV
ncbi:hypothetical protein PYW08_015820 [Mythimna loreyi]|uniref:Uncharacterized protein n=1 Tax=Mythimna loreyi TaxID=667449 RepID=A0ACC2QTZ3_9NEOP|nr:hypothetical protein PYW08_015820 [Mythimna loreyi]